MVCGIQAWQQATDGQASSHGDHSRYISSELLHYISVFTPLSPAAIGAMQSSPESSASTLPRKRSKDSEAADPSNAASAASGIDGDWRYMRRDVIGNSVKNKHVPVKKMGMAPTVPCFHIVMLCSAVILSACCRELLRSRTRWNLLEPNKRTELKQGRQWT